MLDDLVRMHDVDRPVVEGPALIEIADQYVESSAASQRGAAGDELDPVDLLWRNAEPLANLIGPGAVVAADVEQDRRRIHTQGVEDPRAIRRFRVSPQTAHDSGQRPST